MAKHLVIVESPAKAKTINKILGSDFTVRASMGHVRDLPAKNLGVEIDKGFKPKYVLIKGHQKVVKELKDIAAKSDTVYLAPDPDREGEAIAWHLQKALDGSVPEEKFLRVSYNEITPRAVRDAFEHPTTIDTNRVNSQQARRILDRIVGYMVSPLLWSRVKKGLSAGRVQSVALRLVCEREETIRKFVPEEYWLLGAKVRKLEDPRDPFEIRLLKVGEKKADIRSEKDARAILAEIENRDLTVTKIATREISKKPYPPFITSSLQQAGSSVYSFSPSRTMSIAQQLYEGIDLGDGETGLITYMRTDSFTIAADAREQCRGYIKETCGAEFLPEKPNFYKNRAGAQEAHEAIRPTDVARTPDSLSARLNPAQLKIYKLIWQRFVASQMAPAKIAQKTIDIEPAAGGENSTAYTFRASASNILFPGYMKISGIEKASKSGEEDDKRLPPLTENEKLEPVEWLSDRKETQPPGRYSEASLVRALEEHGIGRPSTYAQIISTLDNRKYVTREKRSLQPTELGMSVNSFLTKHLDSLFNVDFTANMEEKLDSVENGSVEWTSMLEEFYKQFNQWVTEVKTSQTDPEKLERMLNLFDQVSEWAPPIKQGKRTYSDSNFVASLKKQLAEKKKPISPRQESVMLSLLHKYAGQIPDVEKTMKSMDMFAEYTAAARPPVKESTQAKLKCLENVNFDPPIEQNGRKRDDKAFAESLRAQVAGGKSLSAAQMKVLDSLVRKYSDQIPDYESRKDELGLTIDQAQADPRTGPILELLKSVTEWTPPFKRGKREWSDKAFYESLSGQFARKGTLSPKQLSSLRRMAAKYGSQIPGYDARAKELDLPPKKAPRPKKKEPDAQSSPSSEGSSESTEPQS